MITTRVVFISNFLNHHVLPLCNSFINTPGVLFHFISTTKTPDEQLKLGYDEMNDKFKFVIKYYEHKNEKKYAESIIKEADVLILDGVWHHFSKLNKTATRFRISERFLKGDCSRVKTILKKIKYFLNTFGEKKNVTLLSCGLYSAQDFNPYYAKILKFGYFPPIEKYNAESLIASKEALSFVWAGRFIDWKHPEYVVNAAKELKKRFLNIRFYMIGDGPLMSDVTKMIDDYNLSNNVILLGSMNHKEVRKVMRKCQIHLLTSDSNEGWGAVLNEGMNSACLPISNRLIGASSYLISDNENGLIFDNYDDFVLKIVEALNYDKNKLTRMQLAAYNTITNMWNSDLCVERMLLIHNEKTKDNIFFNAGPLSNGKKE